MKTFQEFCNELLKFDFNNDGNFSKHEPVKVSRGSNTPYEETYDNGDAKIYRINTFAGMRKMGSGTKWDPVANEKSFNEYGGRDNTIWVIVTGNDKYIVSSVNMEIAYDKNDYALSTNKLLKSLYIPEDSLLNPEQWISEEHFQEEMDKDPVVQYIRSFGGRKKSSTNEGISDTVAKIREAIGAQLKNIGEDIKTDPIVIEKMKKAMNVLDSVAPGYISGQWEKVYSAGENGQEGRSELWNKVAAGVQEIEKMDKEQLIKAVGKDMYSEYKGKKSYFLEMFRDFQNQQLGDRDAL